MMPSIMSGSLIRETPPWARMSAGTRSRAMTATAPASSAILACSALTTSMMTPPLSISAMPRLTRAVPVTVVSLTSGVLLDTVSTSRRLAADHGPPEGRPLRFHRRCWRPAPLHDALSLLGDLLGQDVGLARQGMTGLAEASATQTCPGAKFIGSPVSVVKTVPSFSLGLDQRALNAWPS